MGQKKKKVSSNWLSNAMKKVQKQIKKVVNKVKKVINNIVKMNDNGLKFTAEIGVGEGIGMNKTVLDTYNDVTIGINGGKTYKNIVHYEAYGAPNVGLSETIIHDYNYSHDDDEYSYSHDVHSKFDSKEFKGCPHAIKDAALYFGPFEINNSGPQGFYGLDVSIHLVFGFHFKIGVEDDMIVDVY